jgi:hypothetical protein
VKKINVSQRGKFSYFIAAMIFGGLLTSGSAAFGGSITVTNYSFEQTTTVDGSSSVDNAAPGWVQDPLAFAVYYVGNVSPSPAGTPPATDGVQYLAVTGAGGVVQSNDAIIAAGVTYTLTVDVDETSPALNFGYPGSGYMLELIDDSTTTPTILSSTPQIVTPGEQTTTVQYIAPASGAPVGDELGIELRSLNTIQPNSPTEFDNVRLSDNSGCGRSGKQRLSSVS